MVAFIVAVVLYLLIRRAVRYLMENQDDEIPTYWIVIQWLVTALLWSQWLIQDLANIFVFLPRDLGINWLLFGLVVLVVMQGLMFYQKGGPIQKIVTSKSNVHDIRSATIINFCYAIILFVFKELSDMPMSTTWVFLGLLAGRETAITILMQHRTAGGTAMIIGKDASKAGLGLVVSIALAYVGIWVMG